MTLKEQVLTGMALYWWAVFVLWATRLRVTSSCGLGEWLRPLPRHEDLMGPTQGY